jgi:cephalosporin hydroxylase
MTTGHLNGVTRHGLRLLAPLRHRLAPRVDALAVQRFSTLSRRGDKARNPGAVQDATVRAFSRLTRDCSTAGRAQPAVERAVLDGLRALTNPETVAVPSAAVRQAVLEAFRAVTLADPDIAASPEVSKVVVPAFRALADADLDGAPSPTVRQAVVDQFHRLYYRRSAQTWKQTYWRGVHVWKNPLDLWLYQEILHEVQPDLIVEAGTKYGGSAFFLANLCDLIGRGRIVTIDITEQPNRPVHDRVTYLTGSSTDPEIIERVDQMAAGGRLLVLLDSDHSARHVLAELRAWHTRVPVGSYLVVEDTNVHGHPVFPSHGPGPMEAVDAFLAENDNFVIDQSKHKFFMTFNPRGFLKRVS